MAERKEISEEEELKLRKNKHSLGVTSYTLGAREIFFFKLERTFSHSKTSGRTTLELHFHAQRQFRFLVKPVLAAETASHGTQ